METKLPPLSQRIVTTLLAVVMIVGLAPTQAYAVTSNDADTASIVSTEDEQVTNKETNFDSQEDGIISAIKEVNNTSVALVNNNAIAQDGAQTQDDAEASLASQARLTLKGVHSAQIDSFKLYTYTNGVKGETNLLDGVELEDDPDGGNQMMYVTTVESGDYWVEGYDANNDYNGGIAITVVDGQNNKIKIASAYQIYASNTKTVDGKSVKWEFGTDYTVDYVVKDADGNVHATEFGQADYLGEVCKSSLFIAEGTINATFTPAGEFANDYMPISVAKTATNTKSSLSISASIPKALNITINAPAGSTISVGNMATYYVYTWFDGTVTKDDNTGVSETFKVPSSMTGNRFYRVQNPQGVTYWKYNNWSADSTVEVTADDLHISDVDFSKDTVYRFVKNVYDRADIYLNINQQGYKNMHVGETFELNVFRNWMAIESFMNSKVALPDMHYTVVDTQGNASDVVSITPDENNSSVATMTANKAGTAIVMVTYDSMTHMDGQSSTSSKEFSAIWPECTGMFIVNVGEDGSSIQTNMMIDRVDTESTAIDAEHDILFYLGDEGASYSFTPESGTTVTVDRSVVTDKMTFNGFTSEGVTTDSETGEVTVSGLTTGRHIIKVEKNGVANYQVVTARQTSYEVLDENGDEIEDLTTIKAGDTIQLQFSNLVMPCEKMSGLYNNNASIYYQGEDGTMFKSNPGGSFGVYDFSGNPTRQLISLTIPKYWDGDTYSLAGAIKLGGYSTKAPGGHRGVTYASGVNASYNAPETNTVLSSMPNLSISLGQTEFYTGTFNFTDSSGVKIDAKDFTKIELKDAEGNEIEVAEDGTFKALAEKYTYTTYISGYRYATGEIEVTEDDQNVFDIKLDSSSENAWDGVSTSVPEQDANGVYQIKTGAELAWINDQSNLSKEAITNASLVLCNDIDLAGYPWTKGIKGNGGIQFDGAGHKVKDLNASVALIDTVAGDGLVTNLTVEGVTTGSAGIVKTLNGGDITNCVSEVDITTNETSNIGGIVGNVAGGSTISKCINKGNIIATDASNVGGIAGKIAVESFKLINSYNKGDVTGKSMVGGVVGTLSSDSEATACYNLGSVLGTDSNVGGFVGQASSAKLSSCYSAGTITGGNQFVGSGGSSSYEKCYALEDDVLTDSYAELLPEADLKSADLATWYFAPTCNGYPALLWQTDVTFHEASGTGTVVAPTCLDKGYTVYTCSKCNSSYKGNYTEPRGHIAGDDITMHSTYSQYTCTVCKEVVKEYFDPNLSAFTFPDTGVSSISLNADSDYPWVGTDTGLESTCQGVADGESTSILKFNLDYGGKVGFNYSVSSENDHDKLVITLYAPDGKEIPICSGISGESSGTYTGRNLTPGTYQLKLSYIKDSNNDDGKDKGSISNFYVNPGDENSAVSSVIAKINAIYTPVALDCEDSIVTARTAYDSLLPSSQAKVTNYNDLVAAESALAALKAPESDKAAAAVVIEAIDAIGTPITVDSEGKISAARDAYNNLTNSQKALVTNYSTLVDDESTLSALNKSAADSVALQISTLGKVTPGTSDEAIASARAAYDALTDTQKALVPNYQTLVDAEASLDSGYAKQVYNIIDAIGEVTKDSGDALQNARVAYDALTETQKALVSNYNVLESAELAYHDLFAPIILTESLPEAYNGTEYSVLVEATGDPQPTITVTGLPKGITFDSETNTISGIPGKIGTYEVTVEATNDTDSATAVFELTVYKKNLTRLGGTTRLDTMSLIFDNAVPDNNTSEIIVTTAWNYADALSASSMMGAFNATLITTDGETLSTQSKKQIERISNGAANVHILGGSAAISEEVENELKQMPRVGSVDRIYGTSRVETANEIYKYAGEKWGDTCVITNAWNYADALSIGAFCATNDAPIFGASNGTIDENQAKEIKDSNFSKVVIVGGGAAVDPDAVKLALKKVGASSNIEYLVLAGSDRYETSKIIVDWECGNYQEATFQPTNILGQEEFCFATGNGYADALAGVNLAYTHDCPIMLVTESDDCKASFYELAPKMNFAWIFGGGSVVSETIEDWISDAID